MTFFRGPGPFSITAMLTPFSATSVDIAVFEAEVRHQVAAGIDGIVVHDVIGESCALEQREQDLLLRTAVRCADSQLTVIAATGSNCTAKTIERSLRAQELGAKALLLTVPYYTKPTLKGVVDHFRQIDAAVRLPILIDDDPSRTARDFGEEMLVELADLAQVVGICHGPARLAHFANIRASLRNRFKHLSRDDHSLSSFLALGGSGVISALNNIRPAPVTSPNWSFDARSTPQLDTCDVAGLKVAVSLDRPFPTDVRLPLMPLERDEEIVLRTVCAEFLRSDR
ncbi:dihydrodipicolinate synthase family protein [Neorhizobium sp. DAR64860/K0K1]|uniref:dihydrodipicolinate synthase family protein n=1 Tax=Neorhizobium sp. DAR64860/K0K1 TaxID=3421955 RepID=UPI003D291D51